MSHVATVDLKVTDLDALEATCDQLGLELMRGQETYAWWGVSVGQVPDGMTRAELGKCQHAIRIKGTTPRNGGSGPWEIGLIARRDGLPGWELIYDYYGAAGEQLHAMAGKNLANLKRELATEVSARHLMRMGYRVTKSVNALGQRQVIGHKA
jgi:hypothetical protein